MASGAKPFVLLAKVFTTSKEKREEGLPLLRKVAEFESKQDGCGSYCALEPHDEGSNAEVFETYDNRDYLENNHVKSEAYMNLRDAMGQRQLVSAPSELSFFQPKGGFLYRDQTPSVPLNKQFVWIAKFKAHPGKREEFMEAILTHTGNVQRDENETLSFLVLESIEDDVSIVLFERYTSEEYFKNVHFTSDSMKEFRANIGPLMAERVSGGYTASAGFVDKREAIA